MPFQRSYSKVWWGSESQLSGSHADSELSSSYHASSYFTQYQQQQLRHFVPQFQPQQPIGVPSDGTPGYHSLDYNNIKTPASNLSCILEVDDEHNISKLSWEKHDSPGSLRSQDSGFSDNDESHTTRSLGRSTKIISPSSKSTKSTNSGGSCASPTASQTTIATPPTVVPVKRVGRSEFYSPLVSVTRRISFSGSPKPAVAKETSEKEQQDFIDFADGSLESSSPKKERRRSRVTRKNTKPLTPTRRRSAKQTTGHDDDINYDNSSLLVEEISKGEYVAVPEYNNETVYLGEAPAPYHNETVHLGGGDLNLVYGSDESLTTKLNKVQGITIPILFASPLNEWMQHLRFNGEPEVMSTLQAKSISQEAFKNLAITTNTVAKLVRQLQQRAMYMQSDFERIEKILSGVTPTLGLLEALRSAEQLIANVTEFTKVLERRSVFFNDSRPDRRKFEEHLEQIRLITRDTRYSLAQQHYISLESLLDDIHVLKRYLLITIRLVFEKMVRVIVQGVEHSSCDLLLRANINMIATLTNIDYEGFAALTDAFVQNEAVRALLIVCLDHRLTTVRALALRALATICCAPAAIAQLGTCGGVEVLRDILQVMPVNEDARTVKRGAIERREAVSLLTQITAAWHGPQHRVLGLKDCIEAIIEGLTQLVMAGNCAQTLLLCAAALNNLSRMEVTAHYSIMSHETIAVLIEATRLGQEQSSIFLYEQIMALLHNMSLNKKCHSHLANGSIINFITSTYQAEFYRIYDSRAECEAQRRTIKAILHTLTRLVQDSSLGTELLEQQRLPDCLRFSTGASVSEQSQLSANNGHNRDVASLVRQLLSVQRHGEPQQQQQQQQQEQEQEQLDDHQQVLPAVDSPRTGAPKATSFAPLASPTSPTSSGFKLNLSRHESYV